MGGSRIAFVLLLTACGRVGFDGGGIDGAPDGAADSAYAAAIRAARPIAWYRCDESVLPTARDATGNGNDGTYLAATLGARSAIATDANPAAELLDVDVAGIDSGQRFAFEGSAPFSIEMWVNPTAPDAILLGKVSYNATDMRYDGWFVYYDSLSTTLRRARQNIEAAPLPLGQYSYVAATFDGFTVSVYVDAVRGTPEITTNVVTPVAAPFVIGDQVDGRWANMTGLVDEVAIYDRPLTSQEIEEHYALGAGL